MPLMWQSIYATLGDIWSDFSEAMAPKESETSSAIFSYLSQQNRPYSANDLHLNLHKEHGKAAIQKVVDAMVEEGKLKVKVNGKQTCYFVNQVRAQLDIQMSKQTICLILTWDCCSRTYCQHAVMKNLLLWIHKPSR